jgi:3-dehydroquinate dehydratase/shikimate dehydrogenase
MHFVIRRGQNLENMNGFLPHSYPRPSPEATVALVATLDDATTVSASILRKLPPEVSWLQVQADRIGNIPISWLRQHFGGKLLYTLGSGEGRSTHNGDGLNRSRRLIAAAADGYDLIELDGERDTGTNVLEGIPPKQRLICWSGNAVAASELTSRFRQLSQIAARSYLLVMDARHAADGLAPLSFLKSTGRSDVTAYADGEVGRWSRVLAGCLGSPIVFVGSVGADWDSSDGLSPARMIEDFGLPALPNVNRIYGIVGASASKSLSPRLHNAAYRASAYPGLYLPFRVGSLPEFWREFVESKVFDQIGLPIQGLTVASPNKENAVELATIRNRTVLRAISANLLIRRGPAWAATTTDPIGVLANVDRASIVGKRTAVVGCGGSGRAIALALTRARAKVTLVNRCRERGEHASRLLSLPFKSLSGFSVAGYDLIINATPVGSQLDALPFAIDQLDRSAVVVDLVYASRTTALVAGARARGVRAVEGREVLLAQAERQFARMTGLPSPTGLMAERLGLMATSRAP